MATYTNFIPFTDSTDYEACFATTIQMYADIVSQTQCCGSTSVQKALSDANIFITAAGIDVDDQQRYKADVKSAYLTLYSIL